MRRIREIAAVAFLYMICLVATTWPWATRFATDLPALSPAVAHDLALFTSRIGPATFDSLVPHSGPTDTIGPRESIPEIVYFVARRTGIESELAYNLAWVVGVLGIGLGTYLLSRSMKIGVPCAALAGLMVMLSAPIRLRAAGHIEFLYFGTVPLALLAWFRWVGRPAVSTLVLAVISVVFVCLTTLTYSVIFGIMWLLSLGLLAQQARASEEGSIAWLRRRIPGMILLPFVLVATTNRLHFDEISTIAANASVASKVDLNAPMWAFLLPAVGSLLAPLLEFDPFRASGIEFKVHEASSYLGIVVWVFVIRGAVRGLQKLRSPGRADASADAGGLAMWWLAFVLFVLLAVFRFEWMTDQLTFLKWVRVAARFNLGAILCASMIAAVSMSEWLAGLRSNTRRFVAVVAFFAIVIADGAVVPLAPLPLPSEPAARRWLAAKSDATHVIELPLVNASENPLPSIQSLWSLEKQGSTATFETPQLDSAAGWSCPLRADRLMESGFPRSGPVEAFDLVRNADFASYLWLYMNVYHVSHSVTYQSIDGAGLPIRKLESLRWALRHSIIFDDGKGFVSETKRLEPPTYPVALTTTGWLGIQQLKRTFGRRVSNHAELAVVNPHPDRPIRLAVEAAAYRRARTVRVLANGRVVSTWTVAARDPRLYLTPSFSIPPGIQILTLESEGVDEPLPRGGPRSERFAIVVAALTVQWADTRSLASSGIAEIAR
jgi:hypothetical protein